MFGRGIVMLGPGLMCGTHRLVGREDRVALELLVLATQPGDAVDVVDVLRKET